MADSAQSYPPEKTRTGISATLRQILTIDVPVILSEKTPASRRRQARLLLAVSSLPLLGVVAAFGIAPGTSTDDVERQEVVQPLQVVLPTAETAPEQDRYWREERIQRGDTIGSLMARLDIEDSEARNFLLGTSASRSMQRLLPGRSVRAVTTGDGKLVSLRFTNADGSEFLLRRDTVGFVVQQDEQETTTQLAMASGEVETSLFAATDAAGLSDTVALQLADIFSSDVDFHRDLHPGDRFSVVYEAIYREGEFVRSGKILAAQFVNRGLPYRAVYFEDESGRGSYYTPEGKNIRRAFLRSPLEFSRITSGFTTARLHPVLNVLRAHRGVDYAAPVGTRVRATADGTVQFVGTKGGYGKVVVLEHKSGYSTLYAHLSGFADRLRPGQRVEQGDSIGFVGMTGLASGPHLHYEFLVNGVHKDPLSEAIPAAMPIGRDFRQAFQDQTTTLLQRLELIRDTNLVQVN